MSAKPKRIRPKLTPGSPGYVEPQTESQLDAALKSLGCELIDHSSESFSIKSSEGGVTKLEANNRADALLEAWNLMKP